MTKTKSGRELEGTRGYKGPPAARRFFTRVFSLVGLADGRRDSDGDDE